MVIRSYIFCTRNCLVTNFRRSDIILQLLVLKYHFFFLIWIGNREKHINECTFPTVCLPKKYSVFRPNGGSVSLTQEILNICFHNFSIIKISCWYFINWKINTCYGKKINSFFFKFRISNKIICKSIFALISEWLRVKLYWIPKQQNNIFLNI